MRATRTASIRLNVGDHKDNLLNSMDLYTTAYNYCCSVGFENKIKNGVLLHKATYSDTRPYLPSQLAISSRMLATESLKSVFTRMKKTGKQYRCPRSKRVSIRLDKNSYTLWLNKKEVSILTCNGRIRLDITFNKHFEEYLSWKYTSATLSYKKNKFFLRVQFEKDMEDIPSTGKYLGIDRGIKKLAVTSDNRFFLGGETRRVSQRYQRIRRKLQSAGTVSAKRHLRRVSGKEQRFKADVNHRISKEIISKLSPGDTIVLESLSGIRNKRMQKKLRTEVHTWNFYQLEQFLTYKALAKSIYIEYVDARYTSQRCSKCGNIKRSNRKSQSGFRCGKCGFKLNADLNAARNIVLKHLDAKGFLSEIRSSYPDRAEVNQPIVSEKLSSDTSLQACPVGS